VKEGHFSFSTFFQADVSFRRVDGGPLGVDGRGGEAEACQKSDEAEGKVASS